MKKSSWKTTVNESVSSLMFAASFIIGGNLGVFAKIVYVGFSLLVIVAVFLPP